MLNRFRKWLRRWQMGGFEITLICLLVILAAAATQAKDPPWIVRPLRERLIIEHGKLQTLAPAHSVPVVRRRAAHAPTPIARDYAPAPIPRPRPETESDDKPLTDVTEAPTPAVIEPQQIGPWKRYAALVGLLVFIGSMATIIVVRYRRWKAARTL